MSVIAFTLPGRPPSKKNSRELVWAGHRPVFKASEAYLAWHEEMMLRVRRFRPKKPILSASVALTFFAESRRRFDLTNVAESVMDLLVDAEILADDSAFIVPDVQLRLGGVAGKEARVEIEITTPPTNA